MVYSLDDIKDKIICGDVIEELKKFPDESIDCVITSPPYWGLRDYGIEGQIGLEADVDEYIDKMLEVFRQIKRVLKKAGSVWVNIGDSYNSVPCGNKKVSEANEGYDGVYVRVMRRNLSFVDATCSTGLYTKPGSLTARKRVNKKGTKSMLLLPERLVIRLMDEQGWIIRQKVIWGKQIMLNKERRTIGTVLPTSVKDRFNTSWEYLYHLVKNKKYYFDLEAVKLPVKEDIIRRIENYIKNNEASRLNNAELHKIDPLVGDRSTVIYNYSKKLYKDRVMLGMQYLKKYKTGYEGGRKLRKCPNEGWWEGGLKQKEAKQQGMHTFYTHNRRMYYSLTKNIPTVWQINPEAHNFRKELGIDADHFAVFPCELVKIPILSSCPPNGIVLDPFCGSGTTLVVAKQLGRHYVGIDINEKYCQIAQRRIEKEVGVLI